MECRSHSQKVVDSRKCSRIKTEGYDLHILTGYWFQFKVLKSHVDYKALLELVSEAFKKFCFRKGEVRLWRRRREDSFGRRWDGRRRWWLFAVYDRQYQVPVDKKRWTISQSLPYRYEIGPALRTLRNTTCVYFSAIHYKYSCIRASFLPIIESMLITYRHRMWYDTAWIICHCRHVEG